MNIEQTPEQKIQMFEAQVLALETKLADAESEIGDLKGENASLKDEIKEIDDFSDEEIRREFEVRGLADASEGDWRLLAEMIAAKEVDRALDLLAELTEGAISAPVAKMLVSGRQGVLF